MAMTATAMANSIKSSIYQVNDPSSAIALFYSALCDYVEANAEVFYSWVAAQPGTPPTPDPLTVIKAQILCNGNITLSGATDPSAACSAFSNLLNAAAATWIIKFPTGFALSPCFVIPTISISPSGATDMDTAWSIVCAQIIMGIKTATPAMTGSHGSFVGSGTFTSIV